MTRLQSGSGSSTLDDAAAAGREAASTAAAGLQGAEPALVLVYSSIRYDLSALLAGVREVTGQTPLVGATSSGQLRDGELLPPDAGVVVLMLSAGPYLFRTAAVTGLRADGTEAGRQLARAALTAAARDRTEHEALLILADGLAGDLEGLLTGIYRVAGAAIPVVGGAAAADRTFDATYVFHDDEVLTDGAVAVWIGSPRPLRVVSGHGWEAGGVPLLVTRSEGQAVLEIAGRPAREVFLENFREPEPRAFASDQERTSYYSAHSFGLIEPDGSQSIRAVMVDPAGRLTTFSPLPPYCAVEIVSANADLLLSASAGVVADALDGIEDPAVMLTFSCIARMDMMGDRAGEEAALLQQAAGPVSTFGFYTYGEFARTASVSGYHNATITALVL